MTAGPAPDSHLVARIVWESGFDQPSEVRSQQDWLSEFSRKALPDLLADVFNECCPQDQTWRCEALEVDLGRIALSRAEHDLPRRLAAELTRALWQRFGTLPGMNATGPGRSDGATGPAATAFTPSEDGPAGAAALDLLEHLLVHGTLPWWQTRPVTLLPLWQSLLETKSRPLLELLRTIAGQEAVRLRLVWHLGPDRLPALIRLAEPTHADALVEWVETLVARHVQEKLVQDDASGFETAIWVALLTCLFTERGGLFNLTEFTRSHLRHLARTYGIAYEALLARLDRMLQQQAPYLPPRFASLIRAVLARDPLTRTEPSAPVDGQAERAWQVWAGMLARGLAATEDLPALRSSGPVSLRRLFTMLADRDGRRLARTMVAAGSPAAAVLALHLDDPSLRRTVRLLQPADADFILAHVGHSQHLARHGHWPRRAIWQVVLAFLLSEGASRFARRQLVEWTLRESSRRHNIAYAHSLALLIAYARVAGPDPRHYDLLQILLDLHADQDGGSSDETSGSLNAPGWAARTLAPSIWTDAATPRSPATAWIDTARAGGGGSDLPVSLIRSALRWRLRMGRPAPGAPALLRQMPLEGLWRMLPSAEWRRWLLAQPDRARLLPQLATVPAARRWLSRLAPPALRPIEALVEQALHWFRAAGSKAATRDLLEPVVWHLALDPRAAGLSPARFLAQCLLLWCQRLSLGIVECAVRGLEAPPSPLWREAFQLLNRWSLGDGYAPIDQPGLSQRASPAPDAWGQWLQTAVGQAHMLRLLCRQSPPPLHRRHGVATLPALGSPDQRLASAIYQWAWTHPPSFRRLLAKPWRRASVQPQLQARLSGALALPHLLDLIGREEGGNGGGRIAHLIRQWQEWQTRLNLPHPARREAWLWRTLWQAWLYQDWRALEPARLLAAFRLSFLPVFGLNAARLEERLRSARPPAAIAALLSTGPDTAPAKITERPAPKPARPAERPPDPQRLPVTNAGLVLLQSYFPMLFGRLDLLEDGRFPTPAAAHRAVLALQFLACGHARAEEPHLVLNKLLCGLEPSSPVPVQTSFSPAEIALMDGLLKAAISHWPAIGSTSLDGFRGNWLLREGVLADNADHWGLTVMRKPWDILLSRSPFSYAVTKLPWMAKALYVTWPT